MRRYLIVAHRTLGGPHLFDHLRGMIDEDADCEFHVVVPRYHPRELVWSDGTTQAMAQERLDTMLAMLAEQGIEASGEVGSSKPVVAIDAVMQREGTDAFSGIILSTLPRDISHWWQGDVPHKVEKAFPKVPLTHLVTGEIVPT